MGGLTQAAIQADMEHILSDLADSGATETAEVFAKGKAVSSRGTVTILRAEQLSREELQGTGFEQEYEQSIYVIRASEPAGVVKGDIVVMSDGRFRILEFGRGPGVSYRRYDLGGEFQR
jgi:hypothetical protein